MGQKVNPIGLRIGIIKTWPSRWFAKKNYAEYLHEDIWIRDYMKKTYANAAISRIEIERPTSKKLKVTLHTAKPGVIIGKGGAEIEKLKKHLKNVTGREVINLNIQEIREPNLDATLVAENIAQQIEKRVYYKRAMKRMGDQCMQLGVEGVKICVSGRLGGAEIARREWYKKGRTPLHTLRADIDYGMATAITTYGTIGVKVWLFHGEVLSDRDKERLANIKKLTPVDIETLQESSSAATENATTGA